MPRREQPDPYALKIGRRIQSLYKAQQMTLEALAERCGMGKGHLSNIIRGLTIVTVTTLQRIGEGLDIPPAMLLVFPEEDIRDQLLDQVGRLSTGEIEDLVRPHGEKNPAPPKQSKPMSAERFA